MSDSIEHRLTSLEINVKHISDDVIELNNLNKDVLNAMKDHVERDTDEHKEIKEDIQKNKDFNNKLKWSASGIILTSSLVFSLIKVFG